ncbi:MAG: hypothetical protein AB1782_13805 [Cyanobacteriota bacterium]
MNLNKNTGANLTQYGIAIALVGVLLLPVYFTLGDHIVEGLQKMFNIQSGINSQMKINALLSSPGFDPSTLQAGDLGGSYQNPVEVCANGQCTIDYGTIILSGIPSDFSELIETSGVPGGTNEILNLLTQLANQLDSSNPDAASDIRELIALGQDIIAVEEKFESAKNTLLNNSNDFNDYFNALHQVTTIEEYNALNAQYQDLINSTSNMLHMTDFVNISDASNLTIDFYNIANALHPEGVVFFNSNGGVCLPPPHVCDQPNPDNNYLRNLTPSGSYEDYINGTVSLNTINNDATYPEYIDPRSMPNSTNTPIGNYFLKLKTLTDNGTLDNNPAASEILNVLSGELYGMANDLVNVADELGNSNLPPPQHDPFGVDQITANLDSGNPPNSYQSPVEILYQNLADSTTFVRDPINNSLICSGDRANLPEYQDRCN